MIIDANEADRTDGPYQSRTVRLALWEKVSSLAPHQSLQINGAVDALGTVIELKTLQINVAQILKPLGWKYFTERNGDGLTVYRWS